MLATFHATLHGARLRRAQSLYGAAAGLAIVVGQLAGGLLVTVNIAGTIWRPIFWVNVPIGLATLSAAQRFVPATRSQHAATIDPAGTLLFAATLITVLVPLAEGQSNGWPTWTWVVLGCAPIVACLTILVERRFESRGGVPLLPPSLLRIRSMRRGLMLQFLFMLSYGAFMLVFALTVQDGLRASPLRSGLAILPMAVAFFAGAVYPPGDRTAWRSQDRGCRSHGGRDRAGLAILIVRGGWPHVGLLTLAPALAVAGVGQALVFGSLFRFVLADVPEHHAGVGGGVLVTIQQSGLALGVATLGTLYLGLEAHGIPQAFAAATVAQIAIIAVLAVASRAVPHRDPPGDGNSAPTRPVPTDPSHSGGQKN